MANHNQLNTEKFSAAVRTKRGDLGLRLAAEKIGEVSAATLSRVEGGKIPDVKTFLLLCKWLGREPSDFTTANSVMRGTEPSTPEVIEAHLRADRTLSKATAETLIEMIRLAYRKDLRR